MINGPSTTRIPAEIVPLQQADVHPGSPPGAPVDPPGQTQGHSVAHEQAQPLPADNRAASGIPAQDTGQRLATARDSLGRTPSTGNAQHAVRVSADSVQSMESAAVNLRRIATGEALAPADSRQLNKDPKFAAMNGLLNQVAVARQQLSALGVTPPPGGSPQGATLPDHLIDLEQQNLSPDNKALAGKLVRLIQSNLDALERVAAETIPQVNLLSDPVAARVAAPGLLDRLSQGIQGVFVRKTPSVAELPAATTPETNPVTHRLSESFNRLIPPELLQTAGNRLNAVERQNLQARLLGGIQQLARDPQVRFALSAELAFAADGSVAESVAQDDARGGDIAPPSARESWIRSFLDKLNLNPAERSFMDKEIGSTLAAATKDFSTFTLGKALAQGGGGIAFSAELDGRSVIAKQFFSQMLDPAELDELVSEFSNQDGLTNAPNITKAFGVVRMGDSLLLVMDKVEGPPMDKVFSETSFRGSPQERLSSALHVFSGMAKALSSMHARGVAHLDIKPGNTMYNPSSGEAQLIDFGLMKRNGVPSNGLGTAPFMAPEVRKDRPVHTGSDIWALGASLAYQAGIPLFEGLEDADAVLAHVNGGGIPVERGHPSLTANPGLKDLLLACFDTDPDQRPTAAQIMQAVNGDAISPAAAGAAGLSAERLGALDFLSAQKNPMMLTGRGDLARAVDALEPRAQAGV